jgi:hypothetical protein
VQISPELAELAVLRDAGWRFMPLGRAGELVGFAGFLAAGEDAVDVLYVFGRQDCRAVRLMAEAPDVPGGVVWEFHGPLIEAIHEVRSLPASGDPYTSRLITQPGTKLPF